MHSQKAPLEGALCMYVSEVRYGVVDAQFRVMLP